MLIAGVGRALIIIHRLVEAFVSWFGSRKKKTIVISLSFLKSFFISMVIFYVSQGRSPLEVLHR